jgi:hypothetical protein
MAYSRKFAPLFESIGWPFVVDLRDPDIDLTAIMDLVCSDVLNERAADCLATARARLESSARTLRFTI